MPAALQRGMREADRAPAAGPSDLLAQVEPEDERKEPFTSRRAAEFKGTIIRLREIDLNNSSLTYIVPQNRVPSQADIDKSITATSAAERDVGVDFGPSYATQTSYKNGK